MRVNPVQLCRVQLIKNKRWIADQCKVAESFWDRFRGLIGTQSFELGQGLLLRPCHDIHMWMMSIPIDVVFIKYKKSNKSNHIYEVTSLKENLKPWKIFPVRDFQASETLELPVGCIAQNQISVGDQLEIFEFHPLGVLDV